MNSILNGVGMLIMLFGLVGYPTWFFDQPVSKSQFFVLGGFVLWNMR